MIELYKGLPIRTITAVDKNGVENIFNVTTEMVDRLIQDCLITVSSDYIKEVDEFDNSYLYAVPDVIFESEDDVEVITYIKGFIDDDFLISFPENLT